MRTVCVLIIMMASACMTEPRHAVASAHDCAERQTDQRPAPARAVRECLATFITRRKGGKPSDHYDEASRMMLDYYVKKFAGDVNGKTFE